MSSTQQHRESPLKQFVKHITPSFVWNNVRELYLLVCFPNYRNIRGQIKEEKKRKQKEEKYWPQLRTKVITCLKAIPPEEFTQEKKEICEYLQKNPIWFQPYDFIKKYRQLDTVVHLDENNGLPYVIFERKRLYFQRGRDAKSVKKYIAELLSEQDLNSPHKYETEFAHVREGDVVVDTGVAEGNFALSVVEKAKKIYLFEMDKKWLEPLAATFAPWKDKVIIVNKAVSDKDTEGSIRLDTFFDSEKIDFIKADIEGDEPALVRGARKLIERSPDLSLSLCTYHNQTDADILESILRENAMEIEFSKGYLIFLWDKSEGGLQVPYLRRGIIRGRKITDRGS